MLTITPKESWKIIFLPQLTLRHFDPFPSSCSRIPLHFPSCFLKVTKLQRKEQYNFLNQCKMPCVSTSVWPLRQFYTVPIQPTWLWPKQVRDIHLNSSRRPLSTALPSVFSHWRICSTRQSLNLLPRFFVFVFFSLLCPSSWSYFASVNSQQVPTCGKSENAHLQPECFYEPQEWFAMISAQPSSQAVPESRISTPGYTSNNFKIILKPLPISDKKKKKSSSIFFVFGLSVLEKPLCDRHHRHWTEECFSCFASDLLCHLGQFSFYLSLGFPMTKMWWIINLWL